VADAEQLRARLAEHVAERERRPERVRDALLARCRGEQIEPPAPGELIVANTRDGLVAARARGRKGGRRPKLNAEQIALAQQFYDAGERTVQQIADIFNVPRTTVYGHLDDASKGKRPAVQASG
jgi:hypothetical protein